VTDTNDDYTDLVDSGGEVHRWLTEDVRRDPIAHNAEVTV
jgi:hypothetical protein